MGMRRTAALVSLVVLTGCAGLTPEQTKLRNDMLLNVYGDAARECEGRYATMHVVRVSPEGNLSLIADANSRAEAKPFGVCYREGIRVRTERRRAAGLPVPEQVNTDPAIAID